MSLKRGVKRMLAEANAEIDTVSVHDAVSLLNDSDVVFVDIREQVERAQGTVPGSAHAPRAFLEFQADPESDAHNKVFSSGKRLLLFCRSGGRSALAAKTLLDMGVPNVAHIAGGFAAWEAASAPVARP
ncbi:MAG: rhodanese-like domain-containing protein [Pseudomonadales bacterium]